MAGYATPTRSAGHAPAGAAADPKLTFQADHSVGAGHHGEDDDDVLFVKGPSIAFNSTLDPAEIEAAIEADPEAAASEWLGEFRSDVSAFVDAAVIETLVPRGVHEIG